MTAPALRLAALGLFAAACAPGHLGIRRDPPVAPARESRAAVETRAGPAIPWRPAPGREVQVAIETASGLVGRRAVVVGGVDYGPGCAALVRAALERAGHPLPPDASDAARIHQLADRRGALRSGRRLQPGDVVFFADRPGGPPAHTALVARADPDGTALVLHRLARGVMRLRVNLAWPQQTNDPATGRLVNDTLYVGAEPLPAGSLVVGAADLLR